MNAVAALSRVGEEPWSLRVTAVGLHGLALLIALANLGTTSQLALPTFVWWSAVALSSMVALPVLPRLRFEVDLASPVFVASALLLPAPAALTAVLFGFSSHRFLQRPVPLWPLLYNKAGAALSVGAAALAAQLVMRVEGPRALLLTMGAAVAALVIEGVNTLFVTLFLGIRSRQSLRALLQAAIAPFPHFATNVVLASLVAIPVVVAAEDLGLWSVLLLIPPLALGYSAFAAARESHERAEQLAAQVGELQKLNELGQELLSVSDAHGAERVTRRALSALLEREDVQVALDGQVGSLLNVVKVSGAEPAALGVPKDLPPGSQQVVEAAARLLGVILQRLEMGERLADLQRARAALSQRILEEGARERTRMAMQIHDEALPLVAAADIQTDNVLSALAAGELDRAEQFAHHAQDALTRSNRRLRTMLERIHEQTFAPGGLVAWLEDTLEEVSARHDLKTTLSTPDQPLDLPLPIEILLMEAARNCISNVVRHAHARELRIELEPTELGICLLVRDDGVGFDPATARRPGHGLTLIVQRVELARGVHRITSTPGRGSVVEIEVPL